MPTWAVTQVRSITSSFHAIPPHHLKPVFPSSFYLIKLPMMTHSGLENSGLSANLWRLIDSNEA